MAKLRKKVAPASSAEDVAAIEAQTAAMFEETKAIEADIDAKLKVALKYEQAKAGKGSADDLPTPALVGAELTCVQPDTSSPKPPKSERIPQEPNLIKDQHSRYGISMPDIPTTSAPVEEKISQNTVGDSGEVVTNDATLASPNETLASFHEVEKQIYDKVDELADGFQALMQRFEDELLPLVDRAQAYLSIHGSMHVLGIGLPSWPEWRDAFLKRLKIKMSVRTLQRKLKKFRDEFDDQPQLNDGGPTRDDEASEDETEQTTALAAYESPKELLTKRLKELHMVLSEGTGPVDANPLRDGERRISDALELVESTQLAIDEGLLDVPELLPDAASRNANAIDKWPTAQEVHKALAPVFWRQHMLLTRLAGELCTLEMNTNRWETDESGKYVKGLSTKVQAFRTAMKDVVEFKDAAGKGIWVSFKQADGTRIECRVNGVNGDSCDKVRKTQPKVRSEHEEYKAGIESNYLAVKAAASVTTAAKDGAVSEVVSSESAAGSASEPKVELRCVCRDRENLDDENYVPIPLATLGDRLMGIADELRVAHGLDVFADQIDVIAERVEDREELDRRMEKLAERAAKSPNGISGRSLFKQIRRDRRFVEDMKNILRAGGTTYRGQKILGTKDEPYIWRYTRAEIKAEIKNDLEHQLGVGLIPDCSEEIAAVATVAQQEATTAVDVSRPAAADQELVTIEPVTESIGLPGCTYIYAPAGQANEFAPLAANPYKGCGHGCTYCFNTTRKNKNQKATFHDGAVPRKDYLTLLIKDAKKYQAAGITEQVTLCFSTDAYNPFDTSLTRPTLEIIQQHGMGICVLTKGGTRALADIDLYRPDRDCFASTLTGLDEAFVSKWEPNAASPDDRIAALKAFNKKGIFTWVSLEPTLNVEASLSVVEATHGFVNLYKIGKVNYCKEISDTIDWRDYTLRMIDLCQRIGVKHYIKRDLQPYLPAGHYNPMRVVQHF